MSGYARKNAAESNRLSASLAAGLAIGAAAGSIDALAGLAIWRSHFAAGHIGWIYLQEALGLLVYLPVTFLVSAIAYIIGQLFAEKKTSRSTVGPWAGWPAGISSAVLGFVILAGMLPPTFADRMAINAALLALITIPAGIALGLAADGLVNRINPSGLTRLTMVGWGSVMAGLHLILILGKNPINLSLSWALAVGLTAMVFLLVVGIWFVALGTGSLILNSVYLLIIAVCFSAPALIFWPRTHPVASPVRPDRPANVILIVLDACRADAIGVYGLRNQTPNIDRLAKEAAVFSNAYSQAPWALPSITSLLSSLEPEVLKQGAGYAVPDSVETLAESLRQRDYSTAAFVSSDLLGPETNVYQGFDTVRTLDPVNFLQWFARLPVMNHWYYLAAEACGIRRFADTSEKITDMTLNFMADQIGPYFIWIQFSDPHDPYDPPVKYLPTAYRGRLKAPFAPQDLYRPLGDPAYPRMSEIDRGPVMLSQEDKDYVRELYDAEVKYIDEMVGRIVGSFRGNKKGRPTILIFTSGNGEEFWDHGSFHHGQSLYREQLHVPLIIWGTGIGVRTISEPVALLDVMPTLRELLELPPAQNAQGRSLKPLLDGLSLKPAPVFAAESFSAERMTAVQSKDLKLIHYADTRRYEMFNLQNDANELSDIFKPESPEAKELMKMLDEQGKADQVRRDHLSVKSEIGNIDNIIKEKLQNTGCLK